MSTERITFTFEIPININGETTYDGPYEFIANVEWPLLDRWGWRMRPLKSRRKRAKKV